MRAASARLLMLLVLLLPAFAGCILPGDGDGGARLPGRGDDGGDGNDDVDDGDEGRPDVPVEVPLPDPPEGPWDVHVVVRATHGPHGRAEPVTIDRRFYGQNVADWNAYDYMPKPRDDYLAYLDALEPGLLRWPAGHTSQEFRWERSEDPRNGRTRTITMDHLDKYVALARTVGAEPLIAVNLKTGTPAEAADMVRYANHEKKHGVTWWQIGNEPDHLDGLTPGPEHYAHRYLEFAQAMRAVDPSIKLVGAEVMTGAHVVGSNNRASWMETILRIAGHEMDAVSWHYYPLDSAQTSPRSSAYPTVENLFREDARDWRPSGMGFADEVFPHLQGLIDRYAPGAEIWVTEIAQDSGHGGKEGLIDRHAGALWTADILGRFASHGVDGMAKFVFKSGSSHRYTILDHNYNPRPEYYVYWLYANHFGSHVVHAESDARWDVNGHAALRGDGALTVVLVNKQGVSKDVRLTLEDYAFSAAKAYTIRGDSYDSRTVTLNGGSLHAGNVGDPDSIAAEAWDVSRDHVITVPPLSVTLIVFET